MSDRMTVRSMAQDVFNYYKDNEGKFTTGSQKIQDTGINEFIEAVINEPLPDRDSIQLTDASNIRENHPNWSLEEAKNYAVHTVGLEEQFRFFQLYCQPPKKDKSPIPLARPETQLFCSYFKARWENDFPTTSSSVATTSVIPLVSEIKVQDGDTSASAREEAAGVLPEFHHVRFPGIDTQESVDNDVLMEQPEGFTISPTWTLAEEPYCFQRTFPNARYCLYHVIMPNTKVDRHVNEVWDALVRIAEVKYPALSAKLKDGQLIEAMRPIGQEATKYRGKFATKIHEDLVEYIKKNAGKWGWEPSYAVKDAWKDEEKRDGRIEAVDKFGRLLKWYVLRDKKDLFIQYLSDEKEGLSTFASGPLKAYYETSKGALEKELSKIRFSKYGLTPKEVSEFRMLFMSLVVDPSKVYNKEVASKMAADWKEASEGLDVYHYTNNLNFLLLFLGLGSDTGKFYPNIRSGISYFVSKKAAESKYGLFSSDVFFQAYATSKQQREQLER